MNKRLRLFTTTWGEPHLKLFENAMVRSLTWPLNRNAIAGATWEIWTKREDFETIQDIIKPLNVLPEFYAIDDYLARLKSDYLNDSGVMMAKVFAQAIKRCMNTNSQMLMCPPDSIYGGESIPNILAIGSVPDSVVFVPHMRVHQEILADLPPHSMSNARLVWVSMSNAHKSWTEAEAGQERINTKIGGIFWRRLPGDLYAVQHFLPTPYLINWQQIDYDYFTRIPPPNAWPPVFGEIDHTWPSACIYPQERARFVASSDIAFLSEITPPESNVPPLQHYEPHAADTFWRDAIHNKINRQIIATFRSE